MARTLKKTRVERATPDGRPRPMRRCAWTREAAPKDELLRLVLDPSGGVFVDVLGRAPGRGVYIQPAPSVIEAALAPKGLARLFRGRARQLGLAAATAEAEKTTATAKIAAMVLDRATELVALARRAGQLEVGTETVRQALEKAGPGSTLVLAEDLGVHTERSLREAVARAPHMPRVRIFSTKETLGLRLGRGPTGVLLCRPGPIADRIAAEGRRLAALEGRAAEAETEEERAAEGDANHELPHRDESTLDASRVRPAGGEGQTTRYCE